MKLNALPSPEALLENVDLLCIPSSKDGMAVVYSDILAKVVPASTLPPLNELITGKSGSCLLYGLWKDRRIKMLVCYDGEKMTEATAYTLSKKLAIRAKSENTPNVGFGVHHLIHAGIIQSAVTGWTAGQYDLGLFKRTEDANVKNDQGTLHTHLPAGVDLSAAENGIILGLVQHEVMTLVNLPASHMSPEYLGHWAQRSAKNYKYTCEVFDKQKLTEMGMFALLAVNRGSEQPAQLVVTHYKHPEAKQKIVLIGKGVIFDTGGLSIKD